MKKIISVALAGVMMLSGITCLASDINITIDNKPFVAKNALGEVVEPFIDAGSTYLPVRAMGEAVGKEVAFDAENYAVYIGVKPIAQDVEREPYALIGNSVYYTDQISELYGNLETAVMFEKLKTVAEEKFTKEEIESKADEILTTNATNLTGNMLEEYAYLTACYELIEESIVVGEEVYADYVTVKHVLVEDKTKAYEVIAKLNNNVAIEELIDEYNTDPGQSADSAYTFTYGEMVTEFEQAAFALDEGEYTKEPVGTDYGYHIIMKLPLDKDEVDATVKSNMLMEKVVNIQIDRIVQLEKTGDYAAVENVVYTTDDINYICTLLFGYCPSYEAGFEVIKELIAIGKICDFEGYITEEEYTQAYNQISDEILAPTANREVFKVLLAKYEAVSAKLYGAAEEEYQEFTDKIAVYSELLIVKEIKDVKVFVDGQLIIPCDVNNSYVAPKNIEGTVYVPVRAIVEALGMTADWNNDTRTVVITK